MNSQTFIPVDDLFEVLNDIEDKLVHDPNFYDNILFFLEEKRSEYAEPKGDCCG